MKNGIAPRHCLSARGHWQESTASASGGGQDFLILRAGNQLLRFRAGPESCHSSFIHLKIPKNNHAQHIQTLTVYVLRWCVGDVAC
jgi:hypothetical protein